MESSGRVSRAGDGQRDARRLFVFQLPLLTNKPVAVSLMMKTFLVVTGALLLLAAPVAAEIRPTEPGKPLFEVFELIQKRAGSSNVSFDEKRSLLTVFTLGELILHRDKKSVLIVLNAKDTRAFAALTRKFNGRLLLLRASDRAVQALKIKSPVQNGSIQFDHPQDSPMAEYFRRRFRVGEFK